MTVNTRRIATTTVLVVAAILCSFSQASSLLGSSPLQGGANDPEISEKECAFWLDHDADGEGDQRLAEEYIPQETPVVGGCDFRLNAPVEATIIVESELTDWEAEVEVKQEPGTTDEFKIYSGRPEVPGVAGSMRVIVNFVQGDTPRSGRERNLYGGYRQEVQIPDDFRLLGVTVTTPDGRSDRLEENAQAASSEYISAYRFISERENDRPKWVVSLAREWLAEGYPQVSVTIIDRSGDSAAGTSSGWKWVAIGTWAVLILVAIAVIIYVVRQGNTSSSEPIQFDRRL